MSTANGSVIVGCCGFGMARSRYYETFRAVEIQQTFYQPPLLATMQHWRAEAPEGFEFTIKAWQLITHEPFSPTYRRLKERLDDRQKQQAGAFRWTAVTQRAWDATWKAAQALRARKVIFQCPASFRHTEENKDRLRVFFSRIPRHGITCIWEPRGTWEDGEIRSLCDELDLVHCVDPLKAQALTAGLHYYRLHGPEKGYKGSYSDQHVEQFAELARSNRPAYFMFNNVRMIQDAARFQQVVQRSLAL